MTVMSHVGGMEFLANWATVEHLMQIHLRPRAVLEQAALPAISSGGEHTCVILDDGNVSCWGRGINGRLGTRAPYSETTPTPTSSLGIGRTAVLSERDFDNDETLNVFESTVPSLVTCNPGQYGFYICRMRRLGNMFPH